MTTYRYFMLKKRRIACIFFYIYKVDQLIWLDPVKRINVWANSLYCRWIFQDYTKKKILDENLFLKWIIQ